MDYTKQDVVVIGGGPSGMIAALEAARRGLSVTLLEHNEKLGKKLYITGKGRCNLTNASNLEQLIANTVHNGKFLYSAFSTFGSQDLINYVEALGVPLTIERGNRVFPVSNKASDIIRAFQRALEQSGVRVILRAQVDGIEHEMGSVSGIRTADGRVYECTSAVLATGGITYPATGSTGDGYALAAGVGHTITRPRPALVPLETAETWPRELQGLSLRNVRLTAVQSGKKAFEETGEMLFTHFGVTGPMVLTASSMLDNDRLKEAALLLDMKPGLDLEQLDARILRDFQSNPNRALKNSLFELLPSRFCAIVIAEAGLDPEQPVNQITREKRLGLASTMKKLQMKPSSYRPPEEAVITRGGVVCSEVSPKTMQSKLLGGLYICGELLDVDALTGGFNLQIAFSTGFVAGRSC